MRVAKSVWVSDIHLGTAECRVDILLDFIRQVECENLFLVGDIIDIWALKKLWYWPTSHSVVVQKLLRLARKGVRVTYLPGNHDEEVRALCGHALGSIQIEHEAVYTSIDGRRWLVIHGDSFDNLLRSTSAGHDVLAWFSAGLSLTGRLVNLVGRRLGWRPASLVDRFVRWFGKFGDNHGLFVDNAFANAQEQGVDGVICGHIHAPKIFTRSGVTYMNCGDWTENCTAIVEWLDGSFEIVRFP
jgi:UDP-2,3-diacylglucosamine pyrophosphatase LpxH